MIGGRVARALDPQIMARLAAGRKIILVTGTNGKSTTVKMVRSALATAGAVASNVNGDNMPAGILSALMANPNAPFAALEVDEMYLPTVAAQTSPAAIVLLNLSRDQLDRVGEIGAVERRLRQAVDEHPRAKVIANCDDPLIVSAAWDAPNVTWVAAGSGWGADSASFPRGGGRVVREGDDWWVEGAPEYRRPTPDWWVRDVAAPDVELAGEPEALVCGELVNAAGETWPLRVNVPGRVNLRNAAEAIVAATGLGVPLADALRGVSEVRAVAGRYQTFDVEGRLARLLLAKNPAGWQESLAMRDTAVPQAIVAVNGQVADGEDLSWLWDVDFESLTEAPPETLYSSGERGADLAVRMDYAGSESIFEPDPLAAIKACAPGRVEVLANYTAFRDLLAALKAEGYREVEGAL